MLSIIMVKAKAFETIGRQSELLLKRGVSIEPATKDLMTQNALKEFDRIYSVLKLFARSFPESTEIKSEGELRERIEIFKTTPSNYELFPNLIESTMKAILRVDLGSDVNIFDRTLDLLKEAKIDSDLFIITEPLIKCVTRILDYDPPEQTELPVATASSSGAGTVDTFASRAAGGAARPESLPSSFASGGSGAGTETSSTAVVSGGSGAGTGDVSSSRAAGSSPAIPALIGSRSGTDATLSASAAPTSSGAGATYIPGLYFNFIHYYFNSSNPTTNDVTLGACCYDPNIENMHDRFRALFQHIRSRRVVLEHEYIEILGVSEDTLESESLTRLQGCDVYLRNLHLENEGKSQGSQEPVPMLFRTRKTQREVPPIVGAGSRDGYGAVAPQVPPLIQKYIIQPLPMIDAQNRSTKSRFFQNIILESYFLRN